MSTASEEESEELKSEEGSEELKSLEGRKHFILIVAFITIVPTPVCIPGERARVKESERKRE